MSSPSSLDALIEALRVATGQAATALEPLTA